MWRSVLKSLLVLAGTTVAVPYVITSVSSVLYGWGERKNKVRRTLSPFKVIAFSYTLLQMMQIKLKYISLYIQWKRFYSLAKPSQVLKVYFLNQGKVNIFINIKMYLVSICISLFCKFSTALKPLINMYMNPK